MHWSYNSLALSHWYTIILFIVNTLELLQSNINPLICFLLSGEPDYFGRNEISSGGDLSHYSSASLY